MRRFGLGACAASPQGRSPGRLPPRHSRSLSRAHFAKTSVASPRRRIILKRTAVLYFLPRSTENRTRSSSNWRTPTALVEPLRWLLRPPKRSAAAERLYRETRDGFTPNRMAYDAATVSLDLAILHLRQERLADVLTLAEEMLLIFQAQDVDREALAALSLLQEAARRQEFTVEKVREIVARLRRSATDQKVSLDSLPRSSSFPPSRPAG